METEKQEPVAIPTDADLKQFGYAPGHDIPMCCDCTHEQRIDGRFAFRCREHATAAWALANVAARANRPADEPSALLAQIKRDVETVASWPENVRSNYEAELRAIFHNPGITFPADDGLESEINEIFSTLRQGREDKDLIFYRMPFTLVDEIIAALDKAVTALRAQSEAEVEREIVAWLRSGFHDFREADANEIANAIERGEHRKDGV